MPRPKKIKPGPIKDHSLDHPDIGRGLAPETGGMEEVKLLTHRDVDRIGSSSVEVRDIIQIIAQPHPYTARIGIVHELQDKTLICYAPGKNGFPHKFKIDTDSVTVVGKARLAFNKPLPEDSVYSETERDKI